MVFQSAVIRSKESFSSYLRGMSCASVSARYLIDGLLWHFRAELGPLLQTLPQGHNLPTLNLPQETARGGWSLVPDAEQRGERSRKNGSGRSAVLPQTATSDWVRVSKRKRAAAFSWLSVGIWKGDREKKLQTRLLLPQNRRKSALHYEVKIHKNACVCGGVYSTES